MLANRWVQIAALCAVELCWYLQAAELSVAADKLAWGYSMFARHRLRDQSQLLWLLNQTRSTPRLQRKPGFGCGDPGCLNPPIP
jgi:hypothetical protein